MLRCDHWKKFICLFACRTSTSAALLSFGHKHRTVPTSNETFTFLVWQSEHTAYFYGLLFVLCWVHSLNLCHLKKAIRKTKQNGNHRLIAHLQVQWESIRKVDDDKNSMYRVHWVGCNLNHWWECVSKFWKNCINFFSGKTWQTYVAKASSCKWFFFI